MTMKMKIYRVHLTQPDGESQGYAHFSNRRDAEKHGVAWRDNFEGNKGGFDIAEIIITPTKAGLIEALNQYAGHPDNG